jgi:hypothetical protein
MAPQPVVPVLSDDMAKQAYQLLSDDGDVAEYTLMQRELSGWTPQDEAAFAEAFRRATRTKKAMGEAIEVFGESINPRTYMEMRRDLQMDWTNEDEALFKRAYTSVQGLEDKDKKKILEGKMDEEAIALLQKDLEKEPPIIRDALMGIKSGALDIISTVARPLDIFGGDSVADSINRDLNMIEQAALGADQASETGAAGEYVRGAARSVYTATSLSALGGYGIITGFGLSRANQALTEAEDAGLKGWDKWSYAGRAGAIEAGIAAAFQALGAGGLEKMLGGGQQLTRPGAKEVFKRMGIGLLQELPEENLTEIVDQYNQIASGVAEGELDWNTALDIMKKTTIQTVLALGATGSVQGALIQDSLKSRESQIAGYMEAYGLERDVVEQIVEKAETASQVDGVKPKSKTAQTMSQEDRKAARYQEVLGRELERASLTTSEGAQRWARRNVEDARRLAKAGKITRGAFGEFGLPSMSEAERDSFLRNVEIGISEVDALTQQRLGDIQDADVVEATYDFTHLESPEAIEEAYDRGLTEQQRKMEVEQQKQLIVRDGLERGVTPEQRQVAAQMIAVDQLDMERRDAPRQAMKAEFDNLVGQTMDAMSSLDIAFREGDMKTAQAENQKLIGLNEELKRRFGGMYDADADVARPVDPKLLQPPGRPAPKPKKPTPKPAPRPVVAKPKVEKAAVAQDAPPAQPSAPPPTISRAMEARITEAFPGATVEIREGQADITLPSGRAVGIRVVQDIPVDVDTVMTTYGVSRERAEALAKAGAAGVTVPANVELALPDGGTVRMDKVSALLDPEKADDTTVRHEALHIARQLGLFDTPSGQKVWEALELEYGSEEAIAKAREKWKGPVGLWARIKQFFSRLGARLGIAMSPEAALTETFTEQFWTQREKVLRTAQAEDAGLRYQLPDLPPEDVTSIKNEVVDNLREARGIPELADVSAETQEQWLNEAVETLEGDPMAGERLVNELLSKPRIISDRETAVLQAYYRVANDNFEIVAKDLIAAQDANDSEKVAVAEAAAQEQMSILTKIEEASKTAGREWGRAGVARQIALKQDFSLAGMIRKARVAKGGGELSADDRILIRKMSERIARLEERLSDESMKSEQVEAEAAYAKHAEQTVKEVKARPSQKPTPRPEKIEQGDEKAVTNLAREIERELVQGGMRDRTEIINGVQKALQEFVPGITTRQTMDALSGYGQFSSLSQDAVDQVIRDLHGQMQQLAKLEDMEAGQAPKKTGRERRAPSDEERRLIKQVNEAKKRGGFDSKDPAVQLKTALDAAKNAVRNRIADLSWEIENRQRIVKTPTELEADPELIALRTERNALLEAHKAMFPPQKASKEQRIAAAEKGLDRAIADLEKRLAEGDIAPRRRERLTSPAIEAKRERLNALRAQRDALRAADGEIARRNYEANLRRRIADYQDRIAREDFAVRKKKPRDLSKSELELKRRLEDVKGEFYQKTADYHLARLSPLQRVGDTLREVMHLSRALMTSIDLSALFRQGGLAVYAHPKLAAQASKSMVKALLSKKGEFQAAEAIRNDPMGQFAITSGLAISEPEGKITKQEEAFMGRWAKKVPLVAASGRAYTTFLNNMRFLLFKSMVENVGKGGRVTQDEARVLTKYINAATGRADFKALNNFAASANTVFFAPRYVASRFQYLAMPFYLPFTKTSWRVKRAILSEYARTMTGAATFIGSLMALGYVSAGDDDEPTMEFDPRSSDFLKIRMGETRLDPMAGLQQAMVLSARFWKGETKSLSGDIKSLTAEVDEEGKEKPRAPFARTRWSVVGQFLRTKLAPIPGAAVTVMNDWRDVVGKKHTPTSLAGQLFLPLSLREVRDSIEAQGYARGSVVSMLALFGMGVGTYGERTNYMDAKPFERTEIFRKDVKNAKWDDPALPYSDKLTAEQLAQWDRAKWLHAGRQLYNLTSAPTKGNEKMRTRAREALQGFPPADAMKAFNMYWFKPPAVGKQRTRGDAYRKRLMLIGNALR